ncbi:hypothetical protein HS041_11130 [Planomonospora sp. ID67723]|uniref:hypothetical protein n=1 Tax=Planomonospora sp. ID67723 TaxID=2738134 RepID=UPI0018C35C00|nr:hypothetical protein [Planomonospora sp. ID67723]MBG0828317.1 hypothetical protein [Planomonospora sp. ID67723]
MMRKGMRLLLAAATGAAVFASGTATAFATQNKTAAMACDLVAADVTALTVDDPYVPLKEDATITFEATLKDAWKLDGGTPKKVERNITAVKAEFQRVGETAWNAATIGDLPAVPAPPATGDATLPAEAVKLKGSFKITKDNKDGKWLVRLLVSRGGDTKESCKEVTVDPQVKFVSASVTDPVVISTSGDTEVKVRANVIGASTVKGKLYNNDGGDSVDITLEKGSSANTWFVDTYFDSSFSTGYWTLDLEASRGGQALEVKKADTFSVQRGASKKAKSKISFDVTANKVKKGKSIRLFGKVYRGSSAYAGKMVGLYYKKKGGSWKFAYYVKATGSGQYSKTIKPKFDAYWRANVSGTSKTYGATSGYEYVDVR